MSKVKVDKRDSNRILLTELLPYEVPLLFSNQGFYEYIASGRNEDNKLPLLDRIFERNSFTVPFDYRIKKGQNDFRVLSVMHPASQQKFIELYRNYGTLIIDLCKRSPFTLRAPAKVATHYYEKNRVANKVVYRDPCVELEDDGFSKQPKYSSSYFAYRKYNFLYKFYDSYEFHRLEKKFNLLLKLDISNCFSSIYTHTISWAVKDKKYAKQNKDGLSFEKIFDDLMQQSNYNETNGILIGPEISRIFAEIILQKVDIKVLEALKREGLDSSYDYSIRRYIDDYFIFSNDDKILNRIHELFQEELLVFKLRFNTHKHQKLTLPFITAPTIAKIEMQKLMDGIFSQFSTQHADLDSELKPEDGEQEIVFPLRPIRSPGGISNKIIRDIKCLVRNNCVEYESISAYSFSIAKKKLFAIVSDIDAHSLTEDQVATLANFLLAVLDILFFLYAMDRRVRTTYLLSQIIVFLNKYSKTCPAHIRDAVAKKIYDESVLLLRSIGPSEDKAGVEILTLLIALKDLGADYALEPHYLINLLGLRSKNRDVVAGHLNYFQIIILLYYIGSDARYTSLNTAIEAGILELFLAEPDPFIRSDLTCLFLDTISCPFITVTCKKNLIHHAYMQTFDTKPSVQKTALIHNYVSNRNWFMDWSTDIDLELILQKKELRSPY